MAGTKALIGWTSEPKPSNGEVDVEHVVVTKNQNLFPSNVVLTLIFLVLFVFASSLTLNKFSVVESVKESASLSKLQSLNSTLNAKINHEPFGSLATIQFKKKR